MKTDTQGPERCRHHLDCEAVNYQMRRRYGLAARHCYAPDCRHMTVPIGANWVDIEFGFDDATRACGTVHDKIGTSFPADPWTDSETEIQAFAEHGLDWITAPDALEQFQPKPVAELKAGDRARTKSGDLVTVIEPHFAYFGSSDAPVSHVDVRRENGTRAIIPACELTKDPADLKAGEIWPSLVLCHAIKQVMGMLERAKKTDPENVVRGLQREVRDLREQRESSHRQEKNLTAWVENERKRLAAQHEGVQQFTGTLTGPLIINGSLELKPLGVGDWVWIHSERGRIKTVLTAKDKKRHGEDVDILVIDEGGATRSLRLSDVCREEFSEADYGPAAQPPKEG